MVLMGGGGPWDISSQGPEHCGSLWLTGEERRSPGHKLGAVIRALGNHGECVSRKEKPL